MQTRTLKDQGVRDARLARIHESKVAPLTAFVERIRRTDDPHKPYWAPYFDPKSGGVGAQVLFLLESPGPQVSETMFVSADNPDGTAENVSCLLKLAGLSREKILLWNIFPWQLSAEAVVAPSDAHLEEAVSATLELLSLLPELRAVVLVGGKAERGWAHVAAQLPHLPTVLKCPHPSPVNFGPRPEAAIAALTVFVEANRLSKQ